MLKNRQQVLAAIAVAGIVLLGFDRLILTPLTRAWNQRSARIVELKKSIAQGSVLLDREDAIRQRWDRMRTNTLPLNLSAAEGQVFSAFDRWSRETRIEVSSIKPGRHDYDDYMTLEFRADAAGNLQSLSQFLYAVEKGPPALRVEAIEITSRDNDGQRLTLGLQVSGLILAPPPQQP